MKHSSPLPSWVLFVIAALGSGALYFTSTGLAGVRALVWIAPLPILLFSLHSTSLQSAGAAFVASLVGGLNLVGYLSRLAPAGVVAGSVIIPAIVFTLAVLTYRTAVLHIEHPLAFCAFPVVWTSYEYLLSIASPHGTAGSISYTQSDFLLLIQISSLTGIWGITFIVTLIPAGLAAAWHLRAVKKEALTRVFSVLLVGIGVLMYGWIRLGGAVISQPVRVGVVAMDSAVTYFRTTDNMQALNVISAYSRIAEKIIDEGATVVLMPEKLTGVTSEYEGEVYSMLGASAHHRNALIVAGLNRVGPVRHRNTAAVISPDGKLLVEYDKAYLVPGLEAEYRAGTVLVNFQISELMAGVVICKDMDFPSWIRHYGEAGTGIMFVPAWDFTTDAWLHSRMAIMRAVENGFALVRSANNGLLTICDSRGRIIAETSSSSAPEPYLVGDVQPGSGHTFYAAAGDWFAWINLLFLLIFVLTILTHAIRRSVPENTDRSGDVPTRENVV